MIRIRFIFIVNWVLANHHSILSGDFRAKLNSCDIWRLLQKFFKVNFVGNHRFKKIYRHTSIRITRRGKKLCGESLAASVPIRHNMVTRINAANKSITVIYFFIIVRRNCHANESPNSGLIRPGHFLNPAGNFTEVNIYLN